MTVAPGANADAKVQGLAIVPALSGPFEHTTRPQFGRQVCRWTRQGNSRQQHLTEHIQSLTKHRTHQNDAETC